MEMYLGFSIKPCKLKTSSKEFCLSWMALKEISALIKFHTLLQTYTEKGNRMRPIKDAKLEESRCSLFKDPTVSTSVTQASNFCIL